MPPVSHGVTRRQLVLRGGGAFLLFYGAVASRARAQEQIDDPAALSAARHATIVTVLAAVAAAPGTGLPGEAVELTAEQFGEHYASAPGQLRGYVDDTLDRIEAEAGGFAVLSPDEALGVLRGWSAAGAPDGPTGDPRRALAASALALADLRPEEDELHQVGYILEPV